MSGNVRKCPALKKSQDEMTDWENEPNRTQRNEAKTLRPALQTQISPAAARSWVTKRTQRTGASGVADVDHEVATSVASAISRTTSTPFVKRSPR